MLSLTWRVPGSVKVNIHVHMMEFPYSQHSAGSGWPLGAFKPHRLSRDPAFSLYMTPYQVACHLLSTEVGTNHPALCEVW
jgi:hypothetical protein